MPRQQTSRLERQDTDAQAKLSSPEQLSETVRTLLAEAQALSARLAALNEVAVVMQRSADTSAMLHTMANQARWVLDFQFCAIAEREGTSYRYQVLRGAAPDQPKRVFHSRAIDSVLRQGFAQVAHELTADDDAPPGMRAAMLLPLYDREQVIGTLNFYTGASQRYSQDDLRVATALSMQVAAILRNARLLTEVTRARDELHTVLESISDGVLVVDQHSRLLLANRAIYTLFGLSQSEVAGRRLIWLLTTTSQDGTRLLRDDTLRNALADFKRSTSAQGTEMPEPGQLSGTLILSDGRYLAWVCAPLVALGSLEGYVITIRDVSAQVALDRLRDDLTQMLVHDLRTPLTTILMGLDLLPVYQQAGDQKAEAETLDRTGQAARRLLAQINMLLDMNKLEAGRMELDRMACFLPPLANAVLDMVKPIALANHQRVRLEIPADLPEFSADINLLRRVLENLLGNACKFAPSGSEIVLGARCSDQCCVEIWVQDSGPGIPTHMRQQIFEKYGQMRADARKGTGLGLTFCRLAIEAHGGHITVYDAPVRGSVFLMHLPIEG